MIPKKAFFILSAALLSPLMARIAAAPPPDVAQTVTVTGRVYNAATGYYLKSAEVRVEGTDNFVYTEDGGVYSMTVPVGRVTLTASYVSVQSATANIDAAPGAANVVDFELQALQFGKAEPKGEEVVVLDAFVVSEERVGQAKAIMEQRAAPNAVTIIATDNFGDLTMGAVGEFLKYMPGVTLDYEEVEATAVRIGGLDPKYTGFSMDGVELASSAIDNSRANRLEQMSITGIESIEFAQTLTASMDAGSAAGKLNMKSKYAFNLKRDILRFQVGMDGTSDAIELGRAYMPDDKKHYRTYPGGQINYGGVFLDRRLGIEASVSSYTSFVFQQRNEVDYSYLVPDPAINPGVDFASAEPFIHSIMWRPGPKITNRSAANLSADLKLTQNLVLSLRSSYSLAETEYFNQYTYLRAWDANDGTANYTGPSGGTSPASTTTHWVVNPTSATSNDSSLYTAYSHRLNKQDNYLISPRLRYKKGPLIIEFRGGYSNSRTRMYDGGKGFFRNSGNRIGGIGWTADRPSADSPAWTLTQTYGSDWTQPQNWNRHSTYSFGVRSSPDDRQVSLTSGYLDATYATRIFGHPFTFKSGGGTRYNDFNYTGVDNRYNYIGPTGRQMEAPIPWTQNYVFALDFNGKAGNINDQGWRADNQYDLWWIFEQHPEWFIPATVDNFRRNLLAPKDLTERVDAAYFEANTRFKRLQINAGVRFEGTTTDTKIIKMRPLEDIEAAKAVASPEELASGKFDSDSIPGILYQYYDGRQFSRKSDYSNFFFSGGLKYEITRNLRFQLSASQSILRPDYNNLAGVISYDPEESKSVWVPNPLLKPERATKYYAGLEYYLNPAGIIKLSAYRLDITDKQIRSIDITPEQAQQQVGFNLRDAIVIDTPDQEEPSEDPGEDDEVAPTLAYIRYRSAANAGGTRTIYGATIEYNQQLTFLPGALKGLAVFGSFTTTSMRNVQRDEELIGSLKKSASGGIKYRYGRFNIQLRAAWQDDSLASVTLPVAGRKWFQNDHLYWKARTMVDLSGGFRLNKNLELTFSVRNLLNAPNIVYSNVSSRMYRYDVYGSLWNFSIKGSY